ncbi:hypothetical protein JCGZ_12292 [Jatropha curcas]|uniref:Uncharacterized protein n=1 Tax=Jatropha curcas TaxID=180498 RepID=A0A067K6H9_JATCU|nr:hypothetical protein JCGZ_12292 [Jatropha curcas]
MVDLLGRGGRLDEAMMLIRGMPMKPDIVIWGALLGACRTHGDVRIGKQILKQLLELKPSGSGVYVLLSNLFFEAGKWEGMKNIRKLMNNHEIIKCRGISSIEVEGCIYEFMVDDSRLEVSSNVFRASYHSGIIPAMINKFWDVSDIQTYKINYISIIYINPRPHKEQPHQNPSQRCATCKRELIQQQQQEEEGFLPYKFCSIGCKVIEKLATLDEEQTKKRRRKGIPTRSPLF